MSILGTSTPNVILRLKYAPHESGIKTPLAKEKYGRARKFYSCNGRRDHVSYVNEGSKEKIDYVAYSGDNEKSHGVFNQSGLLTGQQQAALKKQLRGTKSVIWYGVLSFTTEFGNKYVKNNDDALRLMQTELPGFFKDAGFNEGNMTWYAGLHENTKHKHLHFSFFENAPCRYTQRGGKELRYSEGLIFQSVIDRFKISAERRLTDITAELRAARNDVINIAKNVLFSAGNKAGNTAYIQEQIWDLIPLLPEDGRLSYASENMKPLRQRINNIVDLLIKSNKRMYGAFNVFCNAAAEHDERAKRTAASQKINCNGFMTAEKVLEDIYRRLGNYVINTARVFKDKSEPDGRSEPDRRYKPKGSRPGAGSRIQRKQANKRSTASMLTHCLKLGTLIEREAMDAFAEYLAKLKEAEMQTGQSSGKEQAQNEIELD